MKIFKAEQAKDFNILSGNINKLNILILRSFAMFNFSSVRFSVLFDSVAKHRGGHNRFEFVIFNFEVEIVHIKFLLI